MIICSEYFEKEMNVSGYELEVLTDIYLDVADEQEFEPEIEQVKDIVEDVDKFDHVAYHVYEFGSSHDLYDEIAHIF